MGKGKILTGTSGWSYTDWYGNVYPRTRRRLLEFVAAFIDCVEVNVTFYRPVASSTAEGWVDQVEERKGFRFVVKAWSVFTHIQPLRVRGEDVRVFLEGVRPLREAGLLEGVLVQFPPSFKPSSAAREHLRHVRDAFDSERLFLELRAPAWEAEESFLVEELGYLPVRADMPVASPRFNLPCEVVYMRMHGRNREGWTRWGVSRDERYDYLYRVGEVEEVLQRARRESTRCRRVLVMWNNHYRGKALADACLFRALRDDRTVSAPFLLRQAYPDLREYSFSEGFLF